MLCIHHVLHNIANAAAHTRIITFAHSHNIPTTTSPPHSHPYLQIASTYEQLLVSRATKRLILGLGQPPDPPTQIVCHAAAGTGVVITWTPPHVGGQPLFHSYLLEAQTVRDVQGGGHVEGSWVQLADIERVAGEDVVRHVDARLLMQRQRYRVAAWSSYGRSAYVMTQEGGACLPVYARTSRIAMHVGGLLLLGVAGMCVMECLCCC